METNMKNKSATELRKIAERGERAQRELERRAASNWKKHEANFKNKYGVKGD